LSPTADGIARGMPLLFASKLSRLLDVIWRCKPQTRLRPQPVCELHTAPLWRLEVVGSMEGEERMAMNGTIKRMVSDKGFGFVAAEDGNEYFFHQSACTSTPFDSMHEGQAVTFERGQGPKGPRAENVRPV